jgi:hypothetical protein
VVRAHPTVPLFNDLARRPRFLGLFWLPKPSYVCCEGRGMTVSDWAFIISLCSFAVALSGFVWNVWSKFIYPKPRVRISFQATIVFHLGPTVNGPEILTLTATNFGPGDITLHSAILRHYKRGWWKNWRAFFNKHYRRQYGMLNPLEGFPNRLDHSIGPFSGGLPKKVAVGESFSSHFPRQVDWFVHRNVRIGFSDTFGRNHWCSKQDVEKVVSSITDAAQ